MSDKDLIGDVETRRVRSVPFSTGRDEVLPRRVQGWKLYEDAKITTRVFASVRRSRAGFVSPRATFRGASSLTRLLLEVLKCARFFTHSLLYGA